MTTTRKNQHEWGVIAQCHGYYRQFEYCPLCNKYKEVGVEGYIKRHQIPIDAFVVDSRHPYWPETDAIAKAKGEAR